MRSEDSEGNSLRTLDDWRRLHPPEHWEPERSAHTLADFIVNGEGANKLRQRVSAALGEPVEFRLGIPEREIRFDRYGKGRFHDLGVYGETASGKSLFVGVEAKVDEAFGEYVNEASQNAKREIERGIRTNKLRRIRELCARFKHGPGITEDSNVRYQLVHGTAGTVDAGADVSVFFVAVFITDAYDASIGEENLQDYLRFMERAGGESIETDREAASSYLLTLSGKRLACIYQYYDVR